MKKLASHITGKGKKSEQKTETTFQVTAARAALVNFSVIRFVNGFFSIRKRKEKRVLSSF